MSEVYTVWIGLTWLAFKRVQGVGRMSGNVEWALHV